MCISLQDRCYRNAGNSALLDLLPDDPRSVLDVGCGAGDNASLIRYRHPEAQVYGITLSEDEALAAEGSVERVWVCDIENGFPSELAAHQFDAIIFSHVLEHLREPAKIVAQAAALLVEGGYLLIAVPNVVNWRQRWRLMLGRFDYEESGVMDETHLRFFTFDSAERCLLAQAPSLDCMEKRAEGSVPLWLLRRYFLPSAWSAAIDRMAVRVWPNLFGAQVLIMAKKTVQ